MGDFKKLKVWQKSHELVLAVYQSTAGFPGHERFGLTAQLRRAAGSIPANLAEGCGKRTDNEMRRYVRISLGSATELEYHLLLARELGYLAGPTYDSLNGATLAVQNMLAGLSRGISRVRNLRPISQTANSS